MSQERNDEGSEEGERPSGDGFEADAYVEAVDGDVPDEPADAGTDDLAAAAGPDGEPAEPTGGAQSPSHGPPRLPAQRRAMKKAVVVGAVVAVAAAVLGITVGELVLSDEEQGASPAAADTGSAHGEPAPAAAPEPDAGEEEVKLDTVVIGSEDAGPSGGP